MVAPTAVQLPRTAIPLPMDAIAAFCNKWSVSEFALFGSVLRDDFRPGDSDVDVMVVFKPAARPTLFTLGAMTRELRDLFGRPVDLLTRRGVEGMTNVPRRSAILRSARVVYAG
jgi:predicted nucleotidyltransferase